MAISTTEPDTISVFISSFLSSYFLLWCKITLFCEKPSKKDFFSHLYSHSGPLHTYSGIDSNDVLLVGQ